MISSRPLERQTRAKEAATSMLEDEISRIFKNGDDDIADDDDGDASIFDGEFSDFE